jgi:hypothetical protein
MEEWVKATIELLLYFSLEYRTQDAPRIILNKLEKRGYKVVSTTGIGQTIVWTLHKPDTSITNGEL